MPKISLLDRDGTVIAPSALWTDTLIGLTLPCNITIPETSQLSLLTALTESAVKLISGIENFPGRAPASNAELRSDVLREAPMRRAAFTRKLT
jgi:hypothetical protein